ncbi:bifunctional folylpolyglutamate synthase/dihydrofolate synthase [Cerasicoccus maritimus]|uniref:bifunctional folylpolyglutamate synthase/dihydrofolate synthase n=1 Tax=Cerasicoccus maritimus TaxID=490089 RepID=UPI0028525945|nr:folylpolyglutamate synthase/dihydrofolate synthase family protein [Cerasicoccus maritimus]
MPTYAETQDYLYALRNRGAKLGIERMQVFNHALGRPDQHFPIIHVAGTNGKGSVCAMLEAMYRAAGYKTGLFTSPHLIRLGERVQINREPLTDAQIIHYTERLRQTAEGLAVFDPESHPTFFEFMTAMAFLHFMEEAVDVAIIETGLGGRLDSTNIIVPRVSVITSVSLDHQEQLGDTLDAIAREKAGILKPGKNLVLGQLPPEAETAVREVAAKRRCGVTTVSDVFEDDLDNYPPTNLTGDHQRVNAGIAMLAMCHAGADLAVPEDVAFDALMTIDWPGRWQKITLKDGRKLILDATHNPEGCVALENNLLQLKAEFGRNPIILCGTLGENRARTLMDVVTRHTEEIWLLQPDQPRACTHSELRALTVGKFTGALHDATVDELFPQPGVCQVGSEGDTIVITGSIYLLGEVLTRLQEQSGESDLQDRL